VIAQTVRQSTFLEYIVTTQLLEQLIQCEVVNNAIFKTLSYIFLGQYSSTRSTMRHIGTCIWKILFIYNFELYVQFPPELYNLVTYSCTDMNILANQTQWIKPVSTQAMNVWTGAINFYYIVVVDLRVLWLYGHLATKELLKTTVCTRNRRIESIHSMSWLWTKYRYWQNITLCGTESLKYLLTFDIKDKSYHSSQCPSPLFEWE
jgi:hypothetical protein